MLLYWHPFDYPQYLDKTTDDAGVGFVRNSTVALRNFEIYEVIAPAVSFGISTAVVTVLRTIRFLHDTNVRT